MKGSSSAIGSGVGAAVSGGVLWWIVNRMYTAGGVGWLEQQPWPLNNVYLVAACAGALGLLGGLFAHAPQGRYAQEIADLCREWGFTYHPQVTRDRFRPMPLFKKWSDGSCGLTGAPGRAGNLQGHPELPGHQIGRRLRIEQGRIARVNGGKKVRQSQSNALVQPFCGLVKEPLDIPDIIPVRLEKPRRTDWGSSK